MAIWSLGRCATGTFADSVKESARLSYCNRRKEGFGFVGLSLEELRAPASDASPASPIRRRRCLERAAKRRTAALTHVKPQHLVTPRSRLRTPEAFARGGAERLLGGRRARVRDP